MKTISVLLICLVFIGCTDKDSPIVESVTLPYDDMILMLAENMPEGGLRDFRKNWSDWDSIKQNIVLKSKVVTDDTLNITMILHKWVNYGGDFPKAIVSVLRDNRVLHIFTFNDEYYYSLMSDSITPHSLLRDRISLEHELNFALHKMNSGAKSEGYVKRFVTVFADSLLQMDEYEIADSIVFNEQVMSRFAKMGSSDSRCADKKVINMRRILSLAGNARIKLFDSWIGEFGFWKFEILKDGKDNLIQLEFENKECYRQRGI
ncbi:MAG: hypothetical protein U0289_17750 [Cyclobacteriaceae bacterium]